VDHLNLAEGVMAAAIIAVLELPAVLLAVVVERETVVGEAVVAVAMVEAERPLLNRIDINIVVSVDIVVH
jgi:hypothetical protein